MKAGIAAPPEVKRFSDIRLTPDKELKRKWIKKVALKALVELVVSLAFTGVACFFVATPIGALTMMAVAVGMVAFNVLLNSFIARNLYKAKLYEDVGTSEALNEAKFLRKVTKYLNFFSPFAVSMVFNTTADVVIHESGHALAAELLYKGAKPKIEVKPLGGGTTWHRASQLSKLGQKVGAKTAGLIVSGAGTAMALVGAGANMVLSQAVRKKNPTLSRYFLTMAIVTIATHVFYALSVIWQKVTPAGHDFAKLALGGIHPVLAAITIIAIPLLFKGIAAGIEFIADKVREQHKRRLQESLLAT